MTTEQRFSAITDDIWRESERADVTFGPQYDLPSFKPRVHSTRLGTAVERSMIYGITTEDDAKLAVRNAVERGNLSWAAILIEEVAEAIGASGTEMLRAELVQVAAVAVRWIDSIDQARTLAAEASAQ